MLCFGILFLLGVVLFLVNVLLVIGGIFGDVFVVDNQVFVFVGGVDLVGVFVQNFFFQDGDFWLVFMYNIFCVIDQFLFVVGLCYVEELKDGWFRQGQVQNNVCFNILVNVGVLIVGVVGIGFEVVVGMIGNFLVGFGCFLFVIFVVGVFIMLILFDMIFEDEEFVYIGKVVYEFSDRVSVYVFYMCGFKFGGFNFDLIVVVGGVDLCFDFELIDVIEIGIKFEFVNCCVCLNVMIFDYDIEDFQVFEFMGIQFIIFNVLNVQSCGVEFEFFVFVGNNILLNFGWIYVDFEYLDDCDGGFIIVQINFFCGVQFINVFENVVIFGVDWDDIIGDCFFVFVFVNVCYEDDCCMSMQLNFDFDFQEVNMCGNLCVGFGGYFGKWMVEFWVNNIIDKQMKNVIFNMLFCFGSCSVFFEVLCIYGMMFCINFQLGLSFRFRFV